jgi:hypothetical protein
MAFRTCKGATSDIWRWPALKRNMATRSRQRITTSTQNIISDRCSQKRHNMRRLSPRRDRLSQPGDHGAATRLYSPLGNRIRVRRSVGDSPLKAPASRASAASTQLGRGSFLAAHKRVVSGMQIITPETLEALGSALTNLLVGETVYITADDFKRLTGDALTDFAVEGRFMIGNLSARTNCTVVTTDERVIFTKNPPLNFPASTPAAAQHHF